MKKNGLMKNYLFLSVFCVFFLCCGNLYAFTSSGIEPFNVIAKLPVDRTQVDIHEVVNEVSQAIKDQFGSRSYYRLKPITATENMENLDVVDVVHFPPVNIQGSTEYAALVELWATSDDYYLNRLGAEYGINAPWAVSVYTISAPTLQMLSMAYPNVDVANNMDQITDYVVVAALNPDSVAKVGYNDLSAFNKSLFNTHCDKTSAQISLGVKNALRYGTHYAWDIEGSSLAFSWWQQPSFNVADLLRGSEITNEDIEALPADVVTPSVRIPNADATQIAAALKGYMKQTAPLYKNATMLKPFSDMVRQFMAELFAWDGQQMFEGHYQNPMYDPSNPATGTPVVSVYFADLEDMKAQLPSLLNQFFLPMWEGQNPAGIPLTTQAWKFPRAFALGYNDEVQIVELCSQFYAEMALGTGMHHTPAMPCMASVYQDGTDAVAQMFTAKATFAAFFKDSVIAMKNMNMEVQTYLFALFPDIIYNDVAAMYNGAFQAAGIDTRFPIRSF